MHAIPMINKAERSKVAFPFSCHGVQLEMERAPVAVTSRSPSNTSEDRYVTETFSSRQGQIVAHGFCLPLLSGSDSRRQESQSKHRAGNGDSLRPATWRPIFRV